MNITLAFFGGGGDDYNFSRSKSYCLTHSWMRPYGFIPFRVFVVRKQLELCSPLFNSEPLSITPPANPDRWRREKKTLSSSLRLLCGHTDSWRNVSGVKPVGKKNGARGPTSVRRCIEHRSGNSCNETDAKHQFQHFFCKIHMALTEESCFIGYYPFLIRMRRLNSSLARLCCHYQLNLKN